MPKCLGDTQLFVLDTFLAIKPLRPEYRLGRLLSERISRIEWRDDVRLANKKLGAEGRKSQLVNDSSIQLEGLSPRLDSSGEKTRQSINNSTRFPLSVIASKMVSRELLNPAKRARKTVRILSEV